MNKYDTAIVKQIWHDKALLLYIITIVLIYGITIVSLAICLFSLLLVFDMHEPTTEWMIENFLVLSICYVVTFIAMGIHVLVYPHWEKIREKFRQSK
jgi:hypothetical protein